MMLLTPRETGAFLFAQRSWQTRPVARDRRRPDQGEDNPNRKGVNYLGVTILTGYTRIKREEVREFKAIKMNSWRNAASPLSSYAIPNRYFRELGLFEMTSMQTGYLPQSY